jgi:hypothetical protein
LELLIRDTHLLAISPDSETLEGALESSRFQIECLSVGERLLVPFRPQPLQFGGKVIDILPLKWPGRDIPESSSFA